MPFGKGQISNMKNSAPKIFEYMNSKLLEIGIDNYGINPKSILIKSESQKITQPTKIFDNEKFREVEKMFEEIERGPVSTEQNDADYKAEPGGGLAFDFKDDFMPNFYDVKDNEIELLEKMYGKDFMEGYNKLTDREKESILKCLK